MRGVWCLVVGAMWVSSWALVGGLRGGRLSKWQRAPAVNWVYFNCVGSNPTPPKNKWLWIGFSLRGGSIMAAVVLRAGFVFNRLVCFFKVRWGGCSCPVFILWALFLSGFLGGGLPLVGAVGPLVGLCPGCGWPWAFVLVLAPLQIALQRVVAGPGDFERPGCAGV